MILINKVNNGKVFNNYSSSPNGFPFHKRSIDCVSLFIAR